MLTINTSKLKKKKKKKRKILEIITSHCKKANKIIWIHIENVTR